MLDLASFHFLCSVFLVSSIMPSKQRYCCICSNHGQKIVDGRKVSMHRFPTKTSRRRVWIQRCKHARPTFTFKNYDQTRICSAHFVGGNGPTPGCDIPSIFPKPDGSYKQYKITVFDEPVNDSSQATSVEETLNNDQPSSKDSSFSGEVEGLTVESSTSALDISLMFHDYSGQVPIQSQVRHQNEQIEPDIASVYTQTATKGKCEVAAVQTLNCEKSCIGLQTEKPILTFNDISKNDAKVLFYTGIPDSGIFMALFEELESGMAKQNDKGRPRSMRLIDEFFMVLMRLRLGLLMEDLSDRFRIGKSTCCSIFNRWIDYLDIQLQFLVMWPSRKVIDNTMPQSFQRKYPKCRVIIDCTEIRCETPSSLQIRSLLYSDYKSHMTFKSLIGISPAGVVTFVSDLYSGSISDKQITKLSGLIDLCEEGDAIMADKGFLISDLTTPKGIELIIPPFKQSKRQFTKREVNITRNIANLRIHVEREMERIKNFRILQTTFPISMATQASKIWKICVRLTNLQPPLVLRD